MTSFELLGLIWAVCFWIELYRAWRSARYADEPDPFYRIAFPVVDAALWPLRWMRGL